MALWVFAVTLFVSAFLLFLIQPMVGKMILPNLGGTPQVWNTCMVFFQTALLAGYAYTHTISTRLKLRAQLMVHGILLLIPLLILFTYNQGGWNFYQRINASGTWINTVGQNPIPTTLFVLATVVGLPFFVVSTSAPLLQKWFGNTGHPAARDPYFLYGASNLGSMLSLFFYPALVEPIFTLSQQSWVWTSGYVALVALFFCCVGLVLKAPPDAHLPGADEDKPREQPKTAESKEEKPRETGITAKPKVSPLKTGIKKGAKKGPGPVSKSKIKTTTTAGPSPIMRKRDGYVEPPRSDEVTVMRRLRWVMLAFVPSSLMLGVTTWISVDITAIAMFWVIPLALYLLSFILVFSKWPVVWTGQPHTIMTIAQPIVVVFFIYLLFAFQGNTHSIIAYRAITVGVLAFFLTTMVCHGEMARDRPSPRFLTEFYLWMSVGGMLGGVFNAIVAPVIFKWGLVELNIAIAVACLIRPLVQRMFFPDRFLLLIVGAVAGLFLGFLWLSPELGIFGAIILGLLIGAVYFGFAFSAENSLGWTEKLMLSLSPELGTWFHQKGQELANPPPPGATAESEDLKSRLARQGTAPDYYLMGYFFDVIMAVLAAILFYILLNNQGMIFQQMYTLGQNLFSAQGAAGFARSARTFVLYGIPLLCALLFSPRPIRFGLAISLFFVINSFFVEGIREERGEIVMRKDRSYFGVLRVIWNHGDEKEYRNSDDLRSFAIMNDISKVGNNQQGQGGVRLTWSHAMPLNAEGAQLSSADLLSEDPKVMELAVELREAALLSVEPETAAPYTYLMHGTTHHGLNYQKPDLLRRLATTYYHRKGPVGVIMERLNWFSQPVRHGDEEYKKINDRPAPQHSYWADNRMPASLVGMSAMPLSLTIPAETIVDLWSEPPIATIGLGTGTMASYARPFQHLTFYEIDNIIRGYSEDIVDLPDQSKGPYFNYVYDARKRGANVEIIMGDARYSMRPDTEKLREEQRTEKLDAEGLGGVYKMEGNFSSDRKGGYAIASLPQLRENYYRVIEVDAFSSDAIPIHLLTEEAVRSYLNHVTEDGVVMLHTSNRHVDLVPPALDIIAELTRKDAEMKKKDPSFKAYKYAALVVHCKGQGEDSLFANPEDKTSKAKVWFGSGYRGHFSSEYVMVARHEKYLPQATDPKLVEYYEYNYESGEPYQEYLQEAVQAPYQVWARQPAPNNRVWTDDYSNLLSAFRWGFRSIR